MRILLPLLLAGALLTAFVHPLLLLAFLAGVLAVFFLARNLEFGIILLVFFFPYLGLIIDFGEFETFREVPYLKDINAPFIDIYGLILFTAWLFSTISRLRSFAIVKLLRELPHIKSYFLFWLSGLVSLLRVPSIYFGTALKYFLRPFTFFYLVFFAMPLDILTRIRNQESGIRILDRILVVFYWTGLLSAFNGLLGLILGPHADFIRARPFGFFGVNPLGPNHNLLAETLLATAPAGLILGVQREKWVKWGMFFQWGIALLTFARTAWIAVAVQAALYLALEQRGRIRAFLKDTLPAAIFLLALAGVLAVTTINETVRGSTLSRLDQARIAAFYFERSPLVGQGVGTFIPTLWQTKAFLLEYGEPAEAHGLIFKLAFEQGLLGLITFAVLAGVIIFSIYRTYRTYRTDRSYQTAFIAALLIACGSLVYQLFNTTYYTSKLWVPLAIAVAISKLYADSRHHPTLVS